jgi:hypothetical protein
MFNQSQPRVVARTKEFIARHQLIAYFALTYAFSWTIWFFLPQIANTAVFGPPVAAVVISAIIAPEKVNGSSARRWARFALVFAVALAVWVLFTPTLATHTTFPDWYSLWFPGAVSSTVIALFVSGPLSARRGVRDLLAPLGVRRADWYWYVAALLLGPALWLLPVGLDLAFGGQLPPWPLSVQRLAWSRPHSCGSCSLAAGLKSRGGVVSLC